MNRYSTTCRNQYSKRKATIPQNSTLAHLLVSNRYKTLFCYVPKVACSNWKRIFLVFNGHFTTVDEIERTQAHESPLLDKLIKYREEEIRHKLETYKKIIFVRDPLERVVSAYRNKFAFDYQKKFHHLYGISIIKKYRKNLTREVTDEDHATFNEFVKYLVDLRPTHFRNEHWSEQYKLCSLCDINYDFIGRFESLEADAVRALEFMGASKVVTFPKLEKRPEGQETKSTLEKFYSQISKNEFASLTKMYEIDYELFGYHKPSYSEVVNGLWMALSSHAYLSQSEHTAKSQIWAL